MYKAHLSLPSNVAKISLVAIAAAITLISTTQSQAEEPEIINLSKTEPAINVKINQITLVKLKSNIADALIGNPAIADITIQNSKSFIITGKSYGNTNIILLNKKGETIFNKSISVDDQQENIVRLQRGNARVSYTCSPTCQPTPTLGDDPEHVKAVSGNIDNKIKGISQALSLSSAEPN